MPAPKSKAGTALPLPQLLKCPDQGNTEAPAEPAGTTVTARAVAAGLAAPRLPARVRRLFLRVPPAPRKMTRKLWPVLLMLLKVLPAEVWRVLARPVGQWAAGAGGLPAGGKACRAGCVCVWA